MKNKQTSLPYIVSRFFTVYLPGERGFSEATIISYRDTFKQLLSFCKSHLGVHPDKLTVNDLSRNIIAEFLKFLEAEGKTVSTQNQRLAAIKCFFGYIQYAFPEYLDVASGVLQMRMKKQPEPAVNYMSVDGVACVLQQPNMSVVAGYLHETDSDLAGTQHLRNHGRHLCASGFHRTGRIRKRNERNVHPCDRRTACVSKSQNHRRSRWLALAL